MTVQNLKLRVPVNFPASVVGSGGIKVSKANGVFTIQPDFASISEATPDNIPDPSSKQLWIFDPVTGQYNVLTLTGLSDALHKLTSTTSQTIGTGSKTFTVQTGRDIAIGQWVVATSDADTTNYMTGQVTDYSGTSITIDFVLTSGSGTHADWTIRTTSAVASGTLLSANDLSDLANASDARENLGLGTSAVLDVGTSANQVVQLDGTARLPAVDASQLKRVNGVYTASDIGFDSSGTADNSAAWNTFMDSVTSGAVVRPILDLSGTWYFKNPPKQIPSYVTIQGTPADPAVFVRNYQPGNVIALTGAIGASSSGRTVFLTGALTTGHTLGVGFTSLSVTVTYTVQSGDTLGTVVDKLVTAINANATLAANSITAVKMNWDDNCFGVVSPTSNLGTVGVTETDPDGNISISIPVRVQTGGSHDFTYLNHGDAVGVYGTVGTTESNGQWAVGHRGFNFVDLVGSTFTNAYVSGGTLLDKPLDPFIKLGPTQDGDAYPLNITLLNVTVLAGGTSVGGVGIWGGSYDLSKGNALPAGNASGSLRGHFGCTYNTRMNNIFVSTSTVSGTPYWWASAIFDGSKSTGGNTTDDPSYLLGDAPSGFHGCRDCKLISSAIYSGLYAGLVVRATQSFRGDEVDVINLTPPILGDTVLGGAFNNPNNLSYVKGSQLGTVFRGNYGGTVQTEGYVTAVIAQENSDYVLMEVPYDNDEPDPVGTGSVYYGPRGIVAAGIGTDGWRIHSLTKLRFATNFTDRMTINSDGSVSINQGLQVGGTLVPSGPVAATSSIKSSHATAGVGYAIGAGGAVTQTVSKSTNVSLTAASGAITTMNDALAAGASAMFTVNNGAAAATDVVIANHASGGTVGSYRIDVVAVSAGSFRLKITNTSGGSLSEAIVINFAVFKAVAS